MEPFEEPFAEDVFAGIPICWLVVPKGNGKTTFASGLALYIIEHKVAAYVPVAASSRDQAEWIYRQAQGFVYRSELRGTFKCLEGYRRIRCDAQGSRIQVFAAYDRSGDGIIPGGICVLDELHRHRDLSLYETWKGKLGKRQAQLVVISTAGEVGGEFEEERDRLRHSALTATALSGAPNAYVQSRAGHSQFTVTERYVHAAKHSMPEMAVAAEARLLVEAVDG